MSEEKEKADYYKQVVPIVRLGLRYNYNKLIVRGAENIPEQPAIYSANHVKFVDSLFLALAYHGETGIPLRFAAKQEYFDGKGIDDNGKYGRVVKWVMEHGHMLPVDRESGDPRSFLRLQDAVGQRLANGDSVGLHPEGTRNEDGKLHKFKAGAARMAIAHSVPNVPVGLVYTARSNQSKTDVEVIFGKPVMPEEYDTGPFENLAARQKGEKLSQVIEDRVAHLIGAKQTNVFAKLRKLRGQNQPE